MITEVTGRMKKYTRYTEFGARQLGGRGYRPAEYNFAIRINTRGYNDGSFFNTAALQSGYQVIRKLKSGFRVTNN